MNFNVFLFYFYYVKFFNVLMFIYIFIISIVMMIIFSCLFGLLNFLIYSFFCKYLSFNFCFDRLLKEIVIFVNFFFCIGYRMIFEILFFCIYN